MVARSQLVYQQGPHTRVYITKRSWLDAGVEVLPGDRKFQDYAFPPEIGYPSFARENNNRPIDRQPLSTPSDLGGDPTGFPLTERDIAPIEPADRASRLRRQGGQRRPAFAWLFLWRHVEKSAQACSACNSFRIASPISVVETAVVPSDLMSAVRRPRASTAAIAASSLSASAPMSNE